MQAALAQLTTTAGLPRMTAARSSKSEALPPLEPKDLARLRKTLATGVSLDELDLAGFVLACGCAKGDRKALERFEREVMPAVRAALSRIDSAPGFVDELCQVVRERLLTAPKGTAPRVLQFTGEGTFIAWMKVAATRIALNSKRGAKRAQKREELTEQLPDASPELGLLRRQFAGKLELALKAAIDALDDASRLLLHQYLTDRLTLEQLAVMRGVDKSTISRRLHRIEAELTDAARVELERRYGLGEGQVASAMRAFSGPLQLSVARLVAASVGPKK